MVKSLQLLAVAWSAWKVGVKRLGPFGAVGFSLLAVVGFVFLQEYLTEHYPRVGVSE
jgi:hypothetical protein